VSTDGAYRIGIIDDHQLFLDGISLLVGNIDSNIVVVPHPSSKSMLDALAAGEVYDLIICDLIMRELNGLAFLGALRTMTLPPPVIIMSGISTQPPVQQVRALGAKAFIHKSADPETLKHVIQTVQDGGEWFPDGVATQNATKDARSDSEICTELTKRHEEILTLLAGGAANRDIADKLFISENTVKSHLKQMYANFGVTKRTALVQRARLLGLI
jgi:DNA-binding NarL/FixJ family response regulator